MGIKWELSAKKHKERRIKSVQSWWMKGCQVCITQALNGQIATLKDRKCFVLIIASPKNGEKWENPWADLTRPLSDSSKSSPSVAFCSLCALFCLLEKKKKKVCRLFCSVGPLLHQLSQARESLEAYVVKMLRHVEENEEMGGRWNGMSGETFVRCD